MMISDIKNCHGINTIITNSINRIMAENYILQFGKHKNKDLNTIYEIDPTYFKYLSDYNIYYDHNTDKISRGDASIRDLYDITTSENGNGNLICKSEEWWKELSSLNTRDKMDKVYKCRNEFAYGHFATLYLRLFQIESIEKCREYIANKHLCLICFVRLVPIGTSRINGKPHEDWDSRFLHKKCWVELMNANADDDEN